MGWNLEPLAARLARDVVIDADQVILHFREHRAVTLVGAGRHVRFLGAAHPANRVVVRTPAARALEPRRTLLRFLVEELTFVHRPMLSGGGRGGSPGSRRFFFLML